VGASDSLSGIVVGSFVTVINGVKVIVGVVVGSVVGVAEAEAEAALFSSSSVVEGLDNISPSSSPFGNTIISSSSSIVEGLNNT
jgi:hypothetical protein